MSKRLLVVIMDPNADTRDLLEEIFRGEFHAYVTKLDSPGHLATALRESVADLIVAEISLNRDIDVAALRELKTTHPETPLIVLTAWGVKLEAEEGSIGAEAILKKPFSLDEFVDIAREVLRAK